MGLIGPNLKLVEDVDPTDGRVEVVWIPNERRKEWRNYLRQLTAGESSAPPISSTRCTRVLFRNVNAAVHIDSQVSPGMLAPISVKPYPGALDLVDLNAGSQPCLDPTSVGRGSPPVPDIRDAHRL